MLTLQLRLRNQCSKDSCVCVGGAGEGLTIFGPLFEVPILIAHRLRSAYMTVYVLLEWMWVGHGIPIPCFVCDVFLWKGVCMYMY